MEISKNDVLKDSIYILFINMKLNKNKLLNVLIQGLDWE